MLEKGKISVRQFAILVFMYTLGTSVITLPSLVAGYGQENSWVTVLIAAMIGLLIVVMINKIATIDQNKNLFELLEAIFGVWIGKSLMLLVVIYLFYITATNLRQIGDFITTQVMVETPIQFIMLIFILVSLMGVKLGLEVLARTSEIFFPYAMISLILLIVLVAPQADFANIQPVFRENMEGVLLAVLPASSIPYFQFIIFLAILPYVNKVNEAQRGFYHGVVLGALILIAITFMALAVLGPDFTSRNVYPTYILGKKISIAEFIERIEILVAIAWFFTIFFKITINFYVLSLGLSHLFNLKRPTTLSTPSAFILIILGIILYPNFMYFMEYSNVYWPFIALTIGFVLPLLMLVIGTIKGKQHQSVKK